MDDILKQQLKDAGYACEYNLQSLIEACGEEFGELSYLGEAEPETYRWYAVERRIDEYQRVYGTTPEEAVARLWLAINKK